MWSAPHQHCNLLKHAKCVDHQRDVQIEPLYGLSGAPQKEKMGKNWPKMRKNAKNGHQLAIVGVGRPHVSTPSISGVLGMVTIGVAC